MSNKMDSRPMTNAERREKRQAALEGRIWRRHGGPAGKNMYRVAEKQWAHIIDDERPSQVGKIRTRRHVA